MIDIHSLRSYLKCHFLTPEQFASAANIPHARFRALIKAKSIPGSIYKLWENGAVWSPVGGRHGTPEKTQAPSTWYAKAALWPARQANMLMENHKLTANQTAQILKEEFTEEFRAALLHQDAQTFEYSSLFDGQNLKDALFAEQATKEWNSWIDGGYAVCLRRWDGTHLVTKNVQIQRIRFLTDEGTKPTLTKNEQKSLLDAIKHLDEVMLPFAPYQRPLGSPGKWVDQILTKYGLGHVPQG